ncbi:MAG: hypothetical protein AAF532_13845 [Planctomycetota bacterium]
MRDEDTYDPDYDPVAFDDRGERSGCGCLGYVAAILFGVALTLAGGTVGVVAFVMSRFEFFETPADVAEFTAARIEFDAGDCRAIEASRGDLIFMTVSESTWDPHPDRPGESVLVFQWVEGDLSPFETDVFHATYEEFPQPLEGQILEITSASRGPLGLDGATVDALFADAVDTETDTPYRHVNAVLEIENGTVQITYVAPSELADDEAVADLFARVRVVGIGDGPGEPRPPPPADPAADAG